MKNQESIIERQRKNQHLLYASGLFTDEEVKRIDGIYFKSNFPFDIATYHANVLHVKQTDKMLEKIKRNMPIPKQGSLTIGGYKRHKKVVAKFGGVTIKKAK